MTSVPGNLPPSVLFSRFLSFLFLSRANILDLYRANKQQTMMTMTATPSPNGMPHASIPTRTTSIPILTIQTLTQQSTPLHNGKVL
jgi:hypothetical protein